MSRQTQKRRLERAGFVCIKDLWVPAAYAAKVKQQAAFYADDVAKVLNEPAKPKGRPPIKRITDTEAGKAISTAYAALQRGEISVDQYVAKCVQIRRQQA